MTATSGTPNEAEVLRLALEARIADIHVAIPCTVLRYTSGTEVADVRPAVRRVLPSASADDADVYETMPDLLAVPVLQLAGSGFFLRFTLNPDDPALVLVSEADYAAWRQSGLVSDPQDQRRHSLAHAFVLPVLTRGALPSVPVQEGPGTPTPGMTFGHPSMVVAMTSSQMRVGGFTDAAARASSVDALLQGLKDAIETAVPLAQDGGLQFKTQLLEALDAQSWPLTTASAVLKIGG